MLTYKVEPYSQAYATCNWAVETTLSCTYLAEYAVRFDAGFGPKVYVFCANHLHEFKQRYGDAP